MKLTSANEESEIDLRELFHVVFHKAWIVLSAGVGLAILMFLISYYVMEWKYESTTQLYILSNQDSISEITYSDLETSSYLIKDYMILLTSRFVTDQVITKLGLNMKPEELVKLIRLDNPEETRLLNIRVKYKDPIIAKRIADTLRETTTGLIASISNHEMASRIVEANVPEEPSDPNVKFNTLLGGAIGMVMSAFFIVLAYISDDTLKSAKDIEKYLDTRVVSIIPAPKHRSLQKLILRKKTKNNKRIKNGPCGKE